MDGKGRIFTKDDSIHLFAHTQQLKMAWDVKNWDQKSTKASQT
jgi:hypothetical protein